jgi:ketosteroid isomerase-like protein
MDEVKILEKLEALENQNKALQLRVERAEAVTEIQRLIGHYYNNHVPGTTDEYMTMSSSWQLFADRPDTTYEVADYGLFVGFDNVKAFLDPTRPDKVGQPRRTDGGNGAGAMFEHWLCTPMIVVAEDGQTARGVWHCPGSETAGPMCQWALGRVACDFIKIDGVWKIWHYHYYRIFRTDFDTPWNKMDQSKISRQSDKETYRAVGGDPDRILPTTYFNPFGPDKVMKPIPATPDPYTTWSEDMLPV